jgi:hypothetical protein
VATPNLQLIFQGILAIINNQLTNAPQIAELNLGNPSMGATVINFEPFLSITTSPLTVPLPVSPVKCVIVQNLSATAAILQVGITPTGGSVNTCTIGPGGFIALFDPTETGGGWTSVVLTAASGTVPALVLVGA